MLYSKRSKKWDSMLNKIHQKSLAVLLMKLKLLLIFPKQFSTVVSHSVFFEKKNKTLTTIKHYHDLIFVPKKVKCLQVGESGAGFNSNKKSLLSLSRKRNLKKFFGITSINSFTLSNLLSLKLKLV